MTDLTAITELVMKYISVAGLASDDKLVSMADHPSLFKSIHICQLNFLSRSYAPFSCSVLRQNEGCAHYGKKSDQAHFYLSRRNQKFKSRQKMNSIQKFV
jgi:hypothetical protein